MLRTIPIVEVQGDMTISQETLRRWLKQTLRIFQSCRVISSLAIMFCFLLSGCLTNRPPVSPSEEMLRKGNKYAYEFLEGTPYAGKADFWIEDCEVMRINSLALDRRIRWDIGFDWSRSAMHGSLYSSNDVSLLQFTVKNDGNRITIKAGSGAIDNTIVCEYVIESDQQGNLRVRRVDKQ